MYVLCWEVGFPSNGECWFENTANYSLQLHEGATVRDNLMTTLLVLCTETRGIPLNSYVKFRLNGMPTKTPAATQRFQYVQW